MNMHRRDFFQRTGLGGVVGGEGRIAAARCELFFEIPDDEVAPLG